MGLIMDNVNLWLTGAWPENPSLASTNVLPNQPKTVYDGKVFFCVRYILKQ